MKNYLLKPKNCLLFGVLLTICLTAGVAHADTTNTVLSTLITPTSPEATTTIDQRVATRKATYKSQLSGLDTTALASKCTLAQSALTDVRTKDQKEAAIRLQTYNDLAKRLAFLVDNLSSQNVDATELSAAQNQFVSDINKYLNDAESYKAAIDDSITINCVNDPAGFKASVLDARKWRAQLAPDVAAVKNDQVQLLKALSDERQLLITKSGAKAKTD